MTLEEGLFSRHIGKSIALDSNLLLVLIAGSLGAQLFNSFKRVSGYRMEDYELLVRLLGSFTTLITTPHVLTEVSNLANSLRESYKYDWNAYFAALVGSEKNIGVREQWIPAAELAQRPDFLPFGLTDTALAELTSQALVVTEDYRLSGSLKTRGISVLNFGDLRKLQLDGND
jgi:rRNA-processing protein FCF1